MTLSISASHGAPEVPDSQLYTYLNIIDGTGAALQRDMGLLVVDGRIQALAPMAEIDIGTDQGTEIIDASGLFALPGLIDSHVHLATTPEEDRADELLRRQLYGGITSVRDMAGDVRILAGLARNTRLQQMEGPDVHYAALMAGASFFDDPRPAASSRGGKAGAVPWMQAIDTDTDIVQAVALARGTSASAIKIYANLPAAEVTRIATEAHRQNIKVWAHSMVFPALPREVVAAGVDVISHVCRLVFEATDQRPAQYQHKVVPAYQQIDPDDPRIVAVFDEMASRGTILDATLAMYFRQAQAFEDAAGQPDDYKGCTPDFAANLTRIAHQRGVPVATGTDFFNDPDDPWPGLLQELALLREHAGMTPLEIIRSATQIGARTLGIEQETGTLEIGKRADIILLQRDPLQSFANFHSLVLTVKNGRQYPRQEFDPAAAGFPVLQ
ncbi:amidohydrolase family protein [Kineobactrum salinum]|uniref:Amidohydrolase family protein n=1 Tax=Kineobactrum salinum TaxID=2708301 RepID=A0A6C0U2S5_9GAMM|nr:amidohydrolase family protein [Kineobactrum salinum]QIB66472.1 amidohydrolase family protein [Kineobactrum salinum]